MIVNKVALGFADRQARLRVIEALELRVKQFRGREEIWPFRVPHEPLDLDGLIARALDGEGSVDHDALRSRTVLEFLWDAHRWELWVLALPSGILLYCDSDGDETRVLASARRGNPGEADGLFLERLAESRGEAFGIEMSGPAPDRVRSSIGDRGFLAGVFVELFEGTGAEAELRQDEPVGDFRATVEGWLERVLTAPPHTRRQKRLAEALATERSG
jgi:hypothetical protein